MTMRDVFVQNVYRSVFSNSDSPPILYPVWVSELGNPNIFTPPNASIFCPVGWYCFYVFVCAPWL